MMFLNTRRFSVWLMSFLAVLVIYFIYNRLSRTPSITVNGSKQAIELISDACDLNAGLGKVGGVSVGTVKNARYTKLNAQKQVEAEFGFEELLHQDGNDWEIEEPYYTVYRRGFKCTIRGQRARVTVETLGGRVTPKQGMLTGNVTVRIWPKGKDRMGEAVIYLDDIVFDGDKSLFSTSGLVEFVSRDIRMVGTGMEIIYDGAAERLDLLKINRLQGLNIKRWSRGTVFGQEQQEQQGQETAGKEEGNPGGKVAGKTGQQYRCVLDKNVMIDTLRERLLAEVVSINNIFVAGGADDESATQTADKSATQTADTSGVEATTATQKTQRATETIAPAAAAKSWAVEAEGDVAVTCDGGVVITPMETPVDKETQTAAINLEATSGRTAPGKTTFSGGRIDYDVATGQAVAMGLSQIVFDVNGTSGNNPATVSITSQRETRFEPASNKVSFDGDCRCTVSEVDGNAMRQYFVLADSLDVDLTQKEKTKGGTSLASLDASRSGQNIGRLVASGGDVRLASTKRALDGRLLAGVELKCTRIDYNTVSRDFVADGPGLIKVDNSQTDEPQKGLGRFSLRRKCFAFLRNFNSLEFNGSTNHLIADSNGGSLLVDYLPLEDEVIKDKVAITASRVEADILETAGGRMELGGLTATGAVTYEDKDIEVVGNEFVYDTVAGIIDVRGTKQQPCLFNGTPVDGARCDMKTGRWNTKIKGPGAIK